MRKDVREFIRRLEAAGLRMSKLVPGAQAGVLVDRNKLIVTLCRRKGGKPSATFRVGALRGL